MIEKHNFIGPIQDKNISALEDMLKLGHLPQDNNDTLLFAISKSFHDAINPLLSYANPHCDSQRILLAATDKGMLQVVKFILPYSDPSLDDNMAITSACNSGDPQVLELLLPHASADLDVLGLLSLAAYNGTDGVFNVLYPLCTITDDLGDLLKLCSAQYVQSADILNSLLPFCKNTDDIDEALLNSVAEGALPSVKVLLPYVSSNCNFNQALVYGISMASIDMIDLLFDKADHILVNKRIMQKDMDYGLEYQHFYKLFEAKQTKKLLEDELVPDDYTNRKPRII